ncbi:MAG: hypothetical protein JNL22_17400 [Bacteroidales bacterium]|nr:hypothetical protein [Bacteroidales bacterium]
MKGSRYAIIKLVESSSFIETVNSLTKSAALVLTEYDNWMPKGIRQDKEAELKDFLRLNFSKELGENIHSWWLDVKHPKASTPNWDLISTCNINGKKGLLLVEAKAHWDELKDESRGKPIKANASSDSLKNHEKIGVAILEAKTGIQESGFDLSISRDNCYQLSNRIAHSWWLANQGIPVVLLYLGFLNCTDLKNDKRQLFKDDSDWQTCFKEHANQIGADKILDKWLFCGRGEFITICKSI